MKQRTQNRFLAVVLIFGAMLIGSWPQAVLAQLSCPITQISPSSGNGFISYGPSINGAGNGIAFTSDQDPTGGNANHTQEGFLFRTDTSTFTQLTNTSSPRNGATMGISGDGTTVLVFSDANLTGSNSDESAELFLYNTNTNTLTQITNAVVGGVTGGAINANGTRVAFTSTADYTGDNPDLNRELFLFDSSANPNTVQITDTTGSIGVSGAFSIDGAGNRIAFPSFKNLTGSNTDENNEVYLWDETSATLTQVTNTPAGTGSGAPSISQNGATIAFESTANLTAQNSDGNAEIYQWTLLTNNFVQITNRPTGSGSHTPQSDANGSHIAFRDDASSDVFLFDANTNTITDIEGSGGGFENVAINANGTRVAIGSGFNILLADCGPPPPPPTEVTIQATDPNATEFSGGDQGIFTVTRDGDTTNALTVNFTLAGTATVNDDYESVGTSVTIPANQSSATVTIKAFADAIIEGTETVILTLRGHHKIKFTLWSDVVRWYSSIADECGALGG